MPDRRSLLVYFGLAVVVLGLGARQVLAGRSGDEPATPAEASVPKVTGGSAQRGAGGGARVVVHVAGRVRRPGVYRLREGARVDDAVRRAGGARADADMTAVNLAAEVEDGRQVIVPAKTVAAAPAAAGAGEAAPGQAPVAPINLNTATAEQLQELDGVGPGLAAKILAYRQEHGGFGAVRELGEVPGIGEKRLAAMQEHVTV